MELSSPRPCHLPSVLKSLKLSSPRPCHLPSVLKFLKLSSPRPCHLPSGLKSLKLSSPRPCHLSPVLKSLELSSPRPCQLPSALKSLELSSPRPCHLHGVFSVVLWLPQLCLSLLPEPPRSIAPKYWGDVGAADFPILAVGPNPSPSPRTNCSAVPIPIPSCHHGCCETKTNSRAFLHPSNSHTLQELFQEVCHSLHFQTFGICWTPPLHCVQLSFSLGAHECPLELFLKHEELLGWFLGNPTS